MLITRSTDLASLQFPHTFDRPVSTVDRVAVRTFMASWSPYDHAGHRLAQGLHRRLLGELRALLLHAAPSSSLFPTFLTAALLPSGGHSMVSLNGLTGRYELFTRLLRLLHAVPVGQGVLEIPDTDALDSRDLQSVLSMTVSESRSLTSASAVLDTVARVACEPLRQLRSLIDAPTCYRVALSPVMGYLQLDPRLASVIADDLRLRFDPDAEALLRSAGGGPFRVLWSDHRCRGAMLVQGEFALAVTPMFVTPWLPVAQLADLLWPVSASS